MLTRFLPFVLFLSTFLVLVIVLFLSLNEGDYEQEHE